MWPSLRHRALCLSSEAIHQWKSDLNRSFCSSVVNATNGRNVVELLKLEEVEKILRDVRADDVRVIPVKKQSEFANFVVVATGKSQWHVRNIAQALIYKACSLSYAFLFTSKVAMLCCCMDYTGYFVISSGCIILGSCNVLKQFVVFLRNKKCGQLICWRICG